MRKFKLINADGLEFNLNDSSAFFHMPNGLGYDRDIRGVPAGFDFIVVKDELKQKRISGEIVFSTYTRYQEFVEFCEKKPLVLGYMSIEEWGYLDCAISGIGKSELEKDLDVLVCPITFLGLSAWYKSKKSYVVQTGTGAGKTYPYTYPYTYIDAALGSVEIDNAGVDNSPCKIHIFGPVENPSWALIVDGETILDGEVTATIAAGKKLVIDSSPKTMEIAEYTTDNVFVRDLYQYSDMDTARFIFAPKGKSLMSFSHDGSGEIAATVEVKQIANTL